MPPRKHSAQELASELKRMAARAGEDRDRAELLHEVQVYQEELTVQNEELMRAQAALEETRDRFIELYDFAPNGYLTLNAHGIILQVNLTGAALLGRHRHAIEGMPLMGFVNPAQRASLLDFLRRCRRGSDADAVDAELLLNNGAEPRTVQVFCRPRINTARGEREYLTTLVDVTEPRRLEAERAKVVAERAALASRLLTVQDDERHRIARDLHDDIGQQVTALRLKLERISQAIADDGLRARLVDAQRMFDVLDRRIDFIAGGLRPSVLSLGVVPALQQYVDEWGKTFSVDAQFEAVGIDRTGLAPHVETHIYRIAQEALNNISKHAHATHVGVVLQRAGAGVLLIVEDNGRGFDMTRAAGPPDGGFGLLGMRERAELIGGTLDIDSAPGKGTTVALKVAARLARSS
jgi:PAS domain S-box-containing protein